MTPESQQATARGWKRREGELLDGNHDRIPGSVQWDGDTYHGAPSLRVWCIDERWWWGGRDLEGVEATDEAEALRHALAVRWDVPRDVLARLSELEAEHNGLVTLLRLDAAESRRMVEIVGGIVDDAQRVAKTARKLREERDEARKERGEPWHQATEIAARDQRIARLSRELDDALVMVQRLATGRLSALRGEG